MVNSCCVTGCKNESYPGSSFSFHRFSKNENQKLNWGNAVPGKISKSSVVCSAYFKCRDFIPGYTRKMLKPDAVPSIFPKEIGRYEGASASCAAMSSARMWAWRVHAYGARADLRLERARVPALRAPDHVLVRVRAASVNPLDVSMLGGYGARVLNAQRALERGGGGVEFPLVVGRDFAGEVVRSGAAARLQRGAAVWGVVPPHWPGAHAQYVLVRDRWAGAAPRALSALQAGGALFAALSASAAVRAAGAARRALLLGLGGAGQAALQLLRARRVEVVVGCAAEQRARAEALGAALVLDRAAADYERALADCGPYDAIVDCAGLGGGAAAARRWRFARYVTLSSPLLRAADERGLLLGALAAGAELARQSAAAAAAAAAPAAAAAAAAAPCPPPHVRWAYFAPEPADIELLRRLADRGEFTVEVERVFAWTDAPRAYERLAAGHARGKLLLDFEAPPPASPASPAD